MTILEILAGVMLAASNAPADAYNKCIDSTSTNPEWAGCGETYLKQLDEALTASWRRTFASLEGQSRVQLLEEQRAWIKFKDASCRFYASGDFGREGQVLHFYGCRGAIIEARIADLNGMYELTHPR